MSVLIPTAVIEFGTRRWRVWRMPGASMMNERFAETMERVLQDLPEGEYDRINLTCDVHGWWPWKNLRLLGPGGAPFARVGPGQWLGVDLTSIGRADQTTLTFVTMVADSLNLFIARQGE